MTDVRQKVSASIKARVASRRARPDRTTWGVGQLATVAEIDRVRQLRAQGETVRAIARALGISKSQVGRLLAAG